jgi:D-alanine-D-alanine ligase
MKISVLHDHAEPPGDPAPAQVTDALRRLGHDAALLPVRDSVEGIVSSLREAVPEIVFNMTESFDGKSALDAGLAGLLSLLDLRYTGSSPSGLMLAGDKSMSKKVLGFHGIQTPDFATLYRGALDHADDLAFPVIVKPPQEDASLGITDASVVSGLRELLEKMDELQSAYQQPVMVEQFIDGREFYVGVLGNAHAEALPIVELTFPERREGTMRIASWEAKWEEEEDGASSSRSVLASDLPPELCGRMQTIGLEAFHALRLRDYARIDMRVTAAGEVYVIEVNPNCWLEKSGEFAMAAGRSGLEFDALIGRILELASARYSR